MTEERLRVLLLDDEESLREPLKKYLESNFGYHVDAVASGEEALQLVEEAQGHYDVALIDEVLTDGLDGIQVMQEIKARYPDVESIIFTGWGNESKQRALQSGAFRYLEKPFDTDELAMLIRTAGQQVRLRDIGRAILSERDLDQVLESIAAATRSLALADEAAIVLLDRTTGKLRVHETKTYPPEQRWQRHFIDQDLSRGIIHTGEIMRISDTREDKRVSPTLIDAGIHSFVGVPISSEDGNLGVLYVYSQQAGRFDEWGTVALLQTLAGQAGLAIANAQTFQQIHAYAGYMEALVQAGQGLTQATQQEDQLTLAWDFVREQLKVSTFFVGLYDKQTDVLRFPLVYDKGQPIEIPDRHLGDDPKQWGITGHVVKTRQELYWPTEEKGKQQCEALGLEPVQIGKPSQSCFYLPLKVGGEVIGAVSVQSYDHHVFTPILLDACRALGGQLAVALENARLFEAEAHQRREAETLREIALTLTTTLELQEIFERIFSELRKVVPYDSASVQLLKGDWLEIIAGRGFPNLSGILGASFPVDGDNPNREVMRKRVPLIVSDAQAEYPGFSQEPHIHADIHGWLGAPMLIGDRLIGMIALDKHELGFYGEKHTRLAQTFAAQAAVAIENARLFQEREFLLETSKMVSSAQDLDQSLQTLAERLVNSLAVTFCRISLLDDTGKILTTRAAHPIIGDLAWNPGIGQQYLLSKAPDEAGAIETSQSQILRREENPGLLSSLEHKTGFQGVLKAAVLIPLTVGGKVFGVITLGERRSWERGSFALERVVLCESVADQVAALIARMRLQEQIQSEMQEKGRLLVQVSKAGDAARHIASVMTLGDLHATLESIAKATKEVADCDTVTLYAYNQDKDDFVYPPTALGLKDEEGVRRLDHVDTNSAIRRVLVLDHPHIAEDARTDTVMRRQDGELPSFVSREAVKSSVGIPLNVGDRKVGVMFVSYRSRHHFTADELTNIELFANQAAVAICNAQLYEETTRRANALEALYAASQAVTGTLAIDEILNRIVEQAWGLTEPREEKTHFCHLALVDGNRVRFVAAHPPEAPIILDRVYEIEPEGDVPIGITGRTVVTCRPQLVGNVLEDPDYIEIDSRVRSQLSVPIQKGEQVIGVVGAEHPGYNAFDEDDQQALEALASQASIAIQNARQFRLRERLLKAGEVVTAEGELYPALEVIAESVKETIGCDVVSLYTCDQEKSEISYPSVVVGELYKPQEQADWQLVTEDRKLPIDSLGKHSVIRKLLEHGLSRFAFCSAEDSILGAGEFVVREDIESSAGILLKIGEEVVGILFVNYRSAHRFTDEERQATELFAVQAAVAIRSAQLYDELQKRAAALQALYEAGRAVTGTLSLDEILRRIVEQAWRLAEPRGKLTHFSHLALVAGSKARFTTAYPQNVLPNLRAKLGEIDLEHDKRIGITGRAVKTGEPQLVVNTTDDDDYIEFDDKVHSQLSVPIKISGQVSGVINVEHPEYNAFDKKDQQALEALAAQAAIAIQNARAYEELKRTKGLVGARTAVAWMGMISTAWRHAIEGHAITIREQIQQLRSNLSGGISTRNVEERLTAIEDLAGKILAKPITPPLSAEAGVGSVLINDLVRERINQLWGEEPYKSVRRQLDVALEESATVRVSAEWLKRAFDVLIDNAVEAAAGSAAKQLTVATQSADGGVKVIVTDTGKGIPDDVLPKLFKEQIKKPKGAKGLGMGLLMAQTIVQTYGGEIRVGSTGPTGTTMVIWLPLEA